MRGRKRAPEVALLTAVLGAGSLVAAPPAHAECVTYPGTNPIVITIGGDGLARIPGTPAGLASVCVDVSFDDPQPQVDTEPTVEHGTGCGTPCFVVAWDGVDVGPFSLAVTVTANGTTRTFTHSSPGGPTGHFCINAGMPCP